MKYGLIGERLGHSYSAVVHAELGDYPYELVEIPRGSLENFIKTSDFLGINVTIPYKKEIIPYLDELDDSAREVGAVNTVVRREGRLIGYNTDIYGMRALIEHAGISVAGKKALILGTGGTSLTARALLCSLGAGEIHRVSRAHTEGAITYPAAYEEHSDAEIIINTTPVGMYPNIYDSPIDLSKFPTLCGVVDAVYNPMESSLVRAAKRLGATAVGGLYMLVSQAVRASEIFLGTEYPSDTTEKIFRKMSLKEQNIVLIGMPSSGKSTVGKILAERLARPFFDTDALIEELSHRTPRELIETLGEESFRNTESEAIKNIAGSTGVVIATGGGAVLRESSVEALKMNGRLIFIDRPLDSLTPDKSRPLTSSKDSLEKKYAERYPIYSRVADLRVDGSGTPREVAERILQALGI